MSPRRRSAISRARRGESARGACCERQARALPRSRSRTGRSAPRRLLASASKLPIRLYIDCTESRELMSTRTSPECLPATTTSCRAERSSTTAAPMVPPPPTTMMRTSLSSNGCCGAQRCRVASPRSSDVRHRRTAPGDVWWSWGVKRDTVTLAAAREQAYVASPVRPRSGRRAAATADGELAPARA